VFINTFYFYSNYNIKETHIPAYIKIEAINCKKLSSLDSPSRLTLICQLADELNLFHNTYKKKKIKKIKNKFNIARQTLKEVQTSVITGYKRALRVRGVGYKFNLNMDHHIVTIEVGYSYFLQACFDTEFYPTLYKKSIGLDIQSNNLLRLTTFLSKIRKLRPPDVYKGKGIRYRKDSVR